MDGRKKMHLGREQARRNLIRDLALVSRFSLAASHAEVNCDSLRERMNVPHYDLSAAFIPRPQKIVPLLCRS